MQGVREEKKRSSPTQPSYPKYINGASYVIINEEETKKLIDSVFKATNPSESSETE